MKAKKMFEKLGYAYHENGSENTIVYFVRHCFFIEFALEYKEVFVYAKDEDGEENCPITMDELKAIIQQCRELGWL